VRSGEINQSENISISRLLLPWDLSRLEAVQHIFAQSHPNPCPTIPNPFHPEFSGENNAIFTVLARIPLLSMDVKEAWRGWESGAGNPPDSRLDIMKSSPRISVLAATLCSSQLGSFGFGNMATLNGNGRKGQRIKEYPFGGSNLTTPFHPTSLKFKQTGNSLYIFLF